MELPHSTFELGGWQVQPQLNRLTRPDGGEVQLEPKMMDVLVCLAQHRGEVVSRETLIDAVWPEVFISESVLTRAIAGLRRAFGDDARSPRFIETIAKRGYRLVEPPSPGASPRLTTASGAAAGGSYVVGQWVRADGFYGREAELAEVLDGPRNGVWVVGTRRRGKTSFLKQLEHLASAEPDRRLLPVFWDLQGIADPADLGFSLEEALADAQPCLTRAGLNLDTVRDPDALRMLGALRRRVVEDGRTLLLLCDEAEALRDLGARSATVLGGLRRTLLAHDGVRVVLASGPRLWDLARGSATSPFLDGFLPPIYLGALEEAAARALVSQNRRPRRDRPPLSDEAIDGICRWGGGHPFLLQLLSKRVTELGGLDEALAAVAGDRSVTSLHAVDLELLDEEQRECLLALARPDAVAATVAADEPFLLELAQLGLLEIDRTGRARIAPPSLRDWLAARASGPTLSGPA